MTQELEPLLKRSIFSRSVGYWSARLLRNLEVMGSIPVAAFSFLHKTPTFLKEKTELLSLIKVLKQALWHEDNSRAELLDIAPSELHRLLDN